jgi:hypothetical protein
MVPNARKILGFILGGAFGINTMTLGNIFVYWTQYADCRLADLPHCRLPLCRFAVIKFCCLLKDRRPGSQTILPALAGAAVAIDPMSGD